MGELIRVGKLTKTEMENNPTNQNAYYLNSQMFLLKIKSHGWYKFNGHVDTKLGDQLTSKQITGQLTG